MYDNILKSFDFLYQGEYDKSEKLLKSDNTNSPHVIFNLGWHEIRKGNLKKGFQYFNKGRDVNIFGLNSLSGEIWNGQPIENKTLIFRSEGGLGDQILTFRFAKYFKNMGSNVIIYCNGELIDVFSRHGFYCLNNIIPLELYRPEIKYDYWVPSLSLPHILNLEYNDLDGSPYIFSKESEKIFSITNNTKVGIRWAGNPISEEIHRRLPSKDLIDLSNIPNTEFYSLQRDDACVDNLPFEDMREKMKTIEDTISILDGLDLIITSCTSIAHLSAAMGKPTWILTPIFPYFTWAVPGNKTRWYDSVTLFRQKKHGDWQQPIGEIREELINLTKNKK